jgi:disulfide bond formation protein DsbB
MPSSKIRVGELVALCAVNQRTTGTPMNLNPFTYSSRWLFVLVALACAALLGTGYVLQYFFGQDPCPLCLVQRGFYYGVMAASLAGALHGRAGAAYGALGFLFAVGGAATAGRQVWLQHLPADQVPACGPDLFFMLENFPLSRTIGKLFAGSGQCAEVKWRFLELSIAEWSLVWFVLFGAVALWLFWRSIRTR